MLDRKIPPAISYRFSPAVLFLAFLAIFCMIGEVSAGTKSRESQRRQATDSGNAKAASVSRKDAAVSKRQRRETSRQRRSSAADKAVRATPRNRVETVDVSGNGDRLRSKLSAKSAVILDSRTNAILYGYNESDRRQPASTIKILTGLISIDALNGSESVPVSPHAESMPRSKVYLQQGRQYQANDLINAVLLSSANDASVALAEKISGSESAFANRMTKTARSLGAQDTICKTASGLTADGQCSTVRDLAVMFNYAMHNPEFAQRMARTKADTSEGKTLWSHNKALWRISGAVGGKTGYTLAARQTYVGKFRQGDDEFVVAIMGSETMWDDVARLARHGYKLVAERPALPADSVQNQLAMLRDNLQQVSSREQKNEILVDIKKAQKLSM